ncbi:protein FAR1-RELATED SEQUENCE 5-like [Chenopodium quinoa]|uniref:protein FAR1-RELATED SEQUENCE 5-like n=1 Tax=Chenopodium quinoa TaxID=63459 RepID=UPI000B783117|nr:protein FAR1-RELATED SEQUENCE 5-like [Chenopodium quinoa]
MRDYHYFGDLLVLDTTYRTNKYGMICAPFVAEIRNIFPKGVHHRLCVWHIEQNSKKNIGALRALDGFTDLFGYLLKYCETPPEFEHYWKRMLLKYDCANVDWLNDLYKIKEMWCPVFSKKYWSGEWRSKEKGRDYNTIRGNRHLAFAYIGILVHARSLYTIQAYVLFEEEFIKGTACDHKDAGVSFPEYYYHLWRHGKDMIKHEVVFNKETHAICCTCMLFSEMGLLCSRALRIYHMNCVHKISDDYICKRWTKAAMCSHGLDEPTMKTNVVSTSVWRTQTLGKFVKLVTSCQYSLNARAEVEWYFNLLKEKIESVTGTIDFNEPVEGIEICNSTVGVIFVAPPLHFLQNHLIFLNRICIFIPQPFQVFCISF